MRSILSALTLIIASLIAAMVFPLQAQFEPELRQTGRAGFSAGWRTDQAENLLHWIRRAENEAIVFPQPIASDLRAAIDSADQDRLDQTAYDAALLLLLAYHGACCGTPLPANWHISGAITDGELRGRINAALAADQIDLMLRANQPRHPHYRALADAYADEPEGPRRAWLALNLARWRSLAVPARGRYLIVNTAAQEITLWDGGTRITNWRVIVGKKATPTPVFSAEVTGVVLNPWWEIPRSIAAEGIAAFVRRNPAAARAKGYVYSNGRYRQAPGDNNALGRMKLVMPNRFSVFLHDTPNRELFALDQRALSHGCVRVDHALDFAAKLLDGTDWTQARITEVTAANTTRTAGLAQPIPLFVAYFTAEPDGAGGVRELPDIYRRDGRLGRNPAQLAQSSAPSSCRDRNPRAAASPSETLRKETAPLPT